MNDKYDDIITEDIKNKIKKLPSKTLQAKLLELNSIANILLYDKEDKYHDDYKKIRGNYEINSFNIYTKISNIIQGKTNPDDILTEEDYKKYSINKDFNVSNNINEKSEIKDFWLTALKNCDYFDISEKEEKILHYLKNIKIDLHENKIDLTLSYFFDKNEFFKNEIIKKHYFYNKNNEKLEKSEFDEILWNDKIDEINDNKNEKSKKHFFDMFNKNKVTNNLDENEANFLKNDFMPGILEYYMNLVGHKKYKENNNILGTFNFGDDGKINIKTIK